MGFAGVYTAVYDYTPQGENELAFAEGDLLYILDKSSDDGWWKAKKKTTEFDSEEPVGLIPNNYVEEAQPIQQAKSIYDYTRQTDEEVSFADDVDILIFDTSDPDWTLVQVNSEFGFAPANYIQVVGDVETPEAAPAPPPAVESHHEAEVVEPEPEPEREVPPTPQTTAKSPPGPATALAGILQSQQPPAPSTQSRPIPALPARESPTVTQTLTPPNYDHEEEAPPPSLPRRPLSEQEDPRESLPSLRDHRPPPSPSPRGHLPSPDDFSRGPTRVRSPHDSFKGESGGVQPSPPYSRLALRDEAYPRHSATSPSGYHLYNISEMISIMGKRKKMPTTLGINVATGTIFISPEKSEDGPHQEWTADRLKHYSIEGKHVFVDLVRPSKNVDFHAGAKDTAQEIVAALGEISGGYRAEGLREVIAAGTSGAKKKGIILYDFMAQGDDEVTVGVDDEVIILDDSRSEEWWMVRRLKNGREGVVPSSYIEITGVVDSSTSGVNAGLSSVEQNRLEEARLAKQASRSRRRDSEGTGVIERPKRESKSLKPKPNSLKTRKWTDRSGTFTVVAEFIGLADGKMHLHKQNGVKIAVPVSKMSIEDLEYVEKVTGESLDEDKPLSDIRRRSQMVGDRKVVGASIKKEPDYDWFDFFLRAGVGPHQCERYASNFAKDSMDESVLPDITPDVLRTLGLKEGDILRVTKYIDEKYKRKAKGARNVTFADGDEEPASGGLFSGPGGALRNNTRKGRPAPALQTADVVDPKAFELKDKSESAEGKASSPGKEKSGPAGFEDNAWEVKTPSKPAASSAPSSTSTAAPSQPALTGAMADLSLLQTPLEPTKTGPAPAPKPAEPILSQPPAPQTQQVAQPQQPGANPQFFSQLGQPQMQTLAPQMTGYVQQQMPQLQPQPPTTAMTQGFLTPPPPPRPLSAPNNPPGPNGFGTQPLQPQLTGIPSTAPHIAPPGHSLAELNQQRFQQQQQQLVPQPTGFPSQIPGMGNQFTPQMPQQQSFLNPSQQFMSGQQQQFPALAPQPTGYSPFGQQQQPPMPTGSINSVLPTPLQPQRTGANGFGINPSFTPSPPPIPQQPTAAPLLPQKTGPAPPVRFGVHKDTAKKLMPQPTGKANLSQATPSNPFGF
ncbi:cytoskeleton assembly control protein Sla1 [Arthroderma uncinatum]|uniref:cytoskeleton assembly control protein Sla1 n=1 Tax=Arthroderma uncinatum TaxID=74035 RepID=UPI00144A6EA3|nr:cytoskeleton assembly control protein Sla1 [Arthroderma uncinatum]KAF3482121.1 cytoskeleton assembly control protein Sla1 [Arthroderma uncinatum]